MLARPYRDAIIAFLEERFLPDLSKNIVVERIADPRYFQRRQNNYFGAAFAFEPTLLQSAWFRIALKSSTTCTSWAPEPTLAQDCRACYHRR